MRKVQSWIDATGAVLDALGVWFLVVLFSGAATTLIGMVLRANWELFLVGWTFFGLS